MSVKEKLPAVSETAFSCPHCGAYTTQYWFNVYANSRDKNSTPWIPDKEAKGKILADKTIPEEIKQSFITECERLALGLVSIRKRSSSEYAYNDVENLHLSQCYNCSKVAVWVHTALLFPNKKNSTSPNTDLPGDVIRDFEEARSIVNDSPRAAAALLRLCVQKLCIHLGEQGKAIDDDIANLVAKGLNPLVQKSLDIVRVIGNEAVHPGTIDLNDNPDIANKLFGLINAIADQMITHPKSIEELYAKLPPEKRKAIEERDKNKKQ